MSRAAGIRRAVGWLGGSVAASAVLQYLLYFAAARCLGVADYGAFSLALAAAVIAAPFCDLGTSVSILCTGSRNPEGLSATLGAGLVVRAAACVPVGAAAIAIGGLAGYGDGFAALFVPLYVAAIADGVGALGGAALQARERMATAAMVQVGRNLLRAGALFATVQGAGGAMALAWSFAAASALGAAATMALAAGGRLPSCRWTDVGSTLRAALPFGSAVVATILQAQIATALLGVYVSGNDLGNFHAAFRFVLLLQMVPQVVATASAPLAFRTGLAGVEPSATIYRIKLTVFASIGLLACLGLATCAPQLVALCLGPSFHGAVPLLVALAPLVFVKFVASALRDTLSAISRQDRLALGCWLGLAINVGVGMAAMPSFGPMGAVAAMLCSEVFLAVFVAIQLAGAGMDLALVRLLRQPLAVAAAAALASTILPGPLVALVAVVATTLLLWLRPTPEHRLLIGRAPGGSR